MKIYRFAILFFVFAGNPCLSQNTYPDHPIRLVVPFPTGGGADAVGRIVAQRLTQTLGQQVIVDNRPGATGLIGTDLVAKAIPDGYTLLLAQVNSNAIAPNVYSHVAFDARRDFAAIAYIGYAPILLVAAPSFPGKTMADLVELSRRSPGKYTYASDGNGGIANFAGELFKQVAKVDLLHVPYKGSSPAITDLLGNVVDIGFFTAPPLFAPVKAGRLRALAISTPARSSALPDVPTFSEAGFPGFDLQNWYGLAAPAKTPAAVVAKLNRASNDSLSDPNTKGRLEKIGIEIGDAGPSENFERFMRAELERYGQLVRSAKISTAQ